MVGGPLPAKEPETEAADRAKAPVFGQRKTYGRRESSLLLKVPSVMIARLVSCAVRMGERIQTADDSRRTCDTATHRHPSRDPAGPGRHRGAVHAARRMIPDGLLGCQRRRSERRRGGGPSLSGGLPEAVHRSTQPAGRSARAWIRRRVPALPRAAHPKRCADWAPPDREDEARTSR